MNVSIVEIRVPAKEDQGVKFEVPVVLEVDGRFETHKLMFEACSLGDHDAQMVVAPFDLEDLFRHDQRSLGQIMDLVGEAVQHGRLKLPLLVAA